MVKKAYPGKIISKTITNLKIFVHCEMAWISAIISGPLLPRKIVRTAHRLFALQTDNKLSIRLMSDFYSTTVQYFFSTNLCPKIQGQS